MGRPSKWSPEFKEEAMRLQRESGESITAVAKRLGLSPETLRNWVRRDEIERGERDGLTIAEHTEIRELRRQVRRSVERRSDRVASRTSSSFEASVSGPSSYFEPGRITCLDKQIGRAGVELDSIGACSFSCTRAATISSLRLVIQPRH